MLQQLRLKHFSTYAAFVVWGTAGFMGQPTLAGLFVHLAVIPLGLVGVVWLAHREGRLSITKK